MEQGDNNRQDNLVPWEGRDELNLAEFPIACLSSRPGKTVKTLEFQDRIWDRGRGEWKARRLTISASEKYGLPTALDDEVILGLIQLTREAEFESHRVFFSRYQLIRLLGWRNEGKSYTRLETSLKRWIGVSFYYENAWWDKAKQSWVNESFHILERVSLYDRRRKSVKATDTELALSMFCWNEVVFRSFQSGYLKSIDMELFRRLQSPIGKRLYRLLDKRFYHKPRWEFDLRELACEHVGLSRNYDAGGLKRKLRPAIAELESVGYLKPMDPENRFVRLGRGRWQIHFCRKSVRKRQREPADATVDVEVTLTSRGVNPATAAQLAADHCPEEIRRHVEVLDWLLGHGRGQSPKNPAGFLVQSIRDGYAIPEGFRESNGRRSLRGDSKRSSDRRSPRRRESDDSHKARRTNIEGYLKALTPAQRKLIEDQALTSADPLLASVYDRAVASGSELLVDIYRRMILEKHVGSRRKDGRTERGHHK
jgi:hypothetical protein